MNKQGFTLVEMLIVIVILVTLGLIVTFSITGIVRNSSDKLYQVQVDSIIDATRTYVLKNSSTLSDNNEITLCDLKRASLIDKDLKNPKTEEEFENNLIIKVVKNSDGEYDFNFDGESKMENYDCDFDISANLNGNSPLYVKIGDSHEEYGVIVKNKDLTCSKRTGSATTNESACYYDLTISGNYRNALENNKYNRIGTFVESYVVEDETFSTTITRTIIVEDKTPPVITIGYSGNNHTSSFQTRILETNTATFTCSAYDSVDGVLNCNTIKNDYQNTNVPGTYEIVYTATDSKGNSSTLVVTVIVVSKNKNIVLGLEVSEVNWTSNPVNFRIFPLHSSGCNNYLYSINDSGWITENEFSITTNGRYDLGIKCNNQEEDHFIYDVKNIDSTVPTFEDEATITLKSDENNITYITKSGIPHYYADGPVTLSNPSGATDIGSGINYYQIYVNGELFNNAIISEEGRYEIKIKALDYANNESELKLVAYLVISRSKPTCLFKACSGSECNTLEPIKSSSVTYNNKYQFTTNDFSSSPSILYKFDCVYQYYEYEEDIYNSLNITNDKIYMKEENGSNPNISVNSIMLASGSSSSCDDGVCTKTVPYKVSINFNGFSANESSFATLYLKANALCDRLGNCNTTEVSSMPIWRQN